MLTEFMVTKALLQAIMKFVMFWFFCVDAK